METISRHFKPIPNKNLARQVDKIDFIYLINLDRRPDRWNRCVQQFAPHQILPHRVSGINGWEYTQEVFNDIAMTMSAGMKYDWPVNYRFVPGGTRGEVFDPSLEKSCLHSSAPAGGMGGCMAHLSILNDGYESGYETIWVMEDDITVNGNPHQLAGYVERLSQLASWDVLYTDDDDYFVPANVRAHFGGSTFMRPSLPITEKTIERKAVGDDFYKIGGRTQAHSYLVSRSGMKKIIDHVKTHKLFLPYDTELPCIEDIQLYNLRYDLVHGRDRKYSDTWVRRP